MKLVQNLVGVGVLLSALSLAGCDGDENGPIVFTSSINQVVPEKYEFASRADVNASSVSYSGQTMRHLLINDLNHYIDMGLQAAIDAGDFEGKTKEQILEHLNFYFRFDDAAGADVVITTTTTPVSLQTTYGDVSSGKDLVGKIAGNDQVGQRKDWSTEFVGWGEKGAVTPEGLVNALFSELADNVLAVVNGLPRVDPNGNAISSVYVSESGRDLKQLIQKFLLGSIAYSQAMDDYLDDDLEGKGLLVDNAAVAEGKQYTPLEHHWDEAFGYYGAAINLAAYTDEEIAKKGGRAEYQGAHDENADGAIDFRFEYNFGNSVNSAKRDLGASETAATDFSKVLFDAFLQGRAIISNASGNLTEGELGDLLKQRDIIAENWEMVIVATVVHYINETIQDIKKFGTENASFNDYAKHWSELKGFALGLQFNPHSPLSDTDFATIQQQIGTAPVLSSAGAENIQAYVDGLMAARAKLAEVYNIDASNVGDENGNNGW